MGKEKERSRLPSSGEVAVLFQVGEIAVGDDQVNGSDDTSRAHPPIQAVTRAATQAVQRRPILQVQPTRR